MTLFVGAFFVIAAVISILWLMVRPRANEPVGGSAVTRPGTQIRPLRIPHSLYPLPLGASDTFGH